MGVIFTDEVQSELVKKDESIDESYTEIGRAKTEQLVKKRWTCLPNRPSETRKHIDKNNSKISLKRQAELLGISRSETCYQPRQIDTNTLSVKKRIDEVYAKYLFYGVRRITQ